MNITLRHGASAGIERIPAWLLAALFWAFTFSLFAYRASGQFADFELFSVQRLGVTLVGAVIFGWVVSSLIRASGPEKSKPLAVLATILPASIAVLAARLLLDITAEDGITNFQEDMRWVCLPARHIGRFGTGCTGHCPCEARPLLCQPARRGANDRGNCRNARLPAGRSAGGSHPQS
jgi:hypothetical protein